MSKLYNKSEFKKWIFSVIFSIAILFITIGANYNHLSNTLQNRDDDNKLDLKSADSNPYLFQGNEPALSITDIGNLYEYDQEISIVNQEEINLSYYLDDEHVWKCSKIELNIKNIQDSRNWVKNSGFEAPIIYRKYDSYESNHPYQQNKNPGDRVKTIYEPTATYMRAHFKNCSFERYYDFLYVYNNSFTDEYLVLDGNRSNFYSPWIPGNTIEVTYDSDILYQWYGYYIDYYEFVNTSSNYDINSNTWNFNYEEIPNGKNTYGAGEINGSVGMWVGLYSELISGGQYNYSAGAYSELYQDSNISRGQVLDGYLSFDYYIQNGLSSNENFIYFEINNKRVYSKGMRDSIDAGLNKWHSTGKIYMDLWINTSNIFESVINNQEINISVGIMSGDDITYSNFEDGFQNIVWFDNVSLVLTTIANSTQSEIDLKINNNSLMDNNEWGESSLNLTGSWETNPIKLTVKSLSPKLNFNLDTILYGYHNTTSKIDQLNTEGIIFNILQNGTIYWEFYHNLFMPSQYSDFEFIINKPSNWEIISAFDPTLQSRSFEAGAIGDTFLKINKTQAIFPGWWKFKATSPNYLNNTNTKMFKQGIWGATTFFTGDSTKIKTQINYSNSIPPNLDSTLVNLTIYSPDDEIWYQESQTPFTNGTVIFSEILFSALNTTGGQYNYTIFWSNGTTLGGLKSNFTLIHASYLTILKPDDAKFDNQTGGTVGDLIPLRIYLRDAENDFYISDALVSYNWTTGTEFLVEASLGIYETVLDTADLGGFGLYNIIITTSKVGFIDSNLTLRINLGEDTNLQRLESDSKIVIGSNSTIRFFYYSEFDEEGVPGAQISVNISNPAYYTVQDESDGYYSIEFSTEFIDSLGVYQLVFEFSAIGYELQTHIFRFEIINPPVTHEKPNYLLLGILFASIGIGSIFAALSLRSYVILPRKRRKESELLAETQRFKDIRNIQAIVIIHKFSGIPIFSRSYSILEKHNKELFSGFIQAITTIGEEFTEREIAEHKMKESAKGYGSERIMELDFKYFYCLIADLEEVRTVLVLKEKSSERLKSQLRQLLLALNLNLSEQLQSWDGSLEQFEVILPPILSEYFELYYKESFKLNIRDAEFLKMTKDKSLSKMEIRVLNVIISVAKSKENIINLDTILNLVHEENKDIIIKAIESLIAQKIIIPYKL